MTVEREWAIASVCVCACEFIYMYETIQEYIQNQQLHQQPQIDVRLV